MAPPDVEGAARPRDASGGPKIELLGGVLEENNGEEALQRQARHMRRQARCYHLTPAANDNLVIMGALPWPMNEILFSLGRKAAGDFYYSAKVTRPRPSYEEVVRWFKDTQKQLDRRACTVFRVWSISKANLQTKVTNFTS